jgi:predicted RNA-binding Zn-ribbon protein involved in translation (DUF1610 family)
MGKRVYDVAMRSCHFCGAALEETLIVQRSSLCPACGKELKICLNCRFYSPGAHWDCLESIGDPVFVKDRGNFCEYFQFRRTELSGKDEGQKQKAKESFNKLFGNGM